MMKRTSLHRRGACSAALAFILLAAFLVAPADAQPTGYEGYQVVKITVKDEADLAKLKELEELGRNFQVWSEVTGIGLMEVRVAPTAKGALDASGLAYEIKVEDLQQHIDELYRTPRGGGFFDSLQTYDAHVQFIDDLVAAYPDLADTVLIGRSVEGRRLWALRITGPGEGKPGVMYHGAQHGDEQAGASLVAYTANHLLTNYATDSGVRALVDNVEWFLLPITNPDGYRAYDRQNANNVDLNRNWGGPGGPANAFSEPETAAMRDFFLAHPNVRMHIDVHGYVPWIIWPWGHTPYWCMNHWTFYELGWEVHDLIEASGGGDYEIGTVWSVAYPVYGGSTNYTYGELDLWAFTFELVDSILPSICEEFLSSMLFLAEWISDCNDNDTPDAADIASGTSYDCNFNGVPDECESQADCNDDGVLDVCAFATGSRDCNGNAVPDGCDLASGTSEDCNGDVVPDECQPDEDCNENGVQDICDIAGGMSQDCNSNDIPDECEPDCNDNGIADGCDIADGTSVDCGPNGIPDECETDCNHNGVGDECDIADGVSQDVNGNGVPDECQFRLFVDARAPEGGDGRSWSAAYRSLRDAFSVAADGSGLVEEIWIAAGTYTPAPPQGDRAATFKLVNGVRVIGGFAGWEETVDQRDPFANPTILSGDLNGDDRPGFLNNGDNSYHVLTGSGTDATAVLDGVTITAGNANESTFQQDRGAGMYNTGYCSPTLVNCTFRDNFAEHSGGGMYNSGGSAPKLTGCAFSENTAFSAPVSGSGGGMYNDTDSNPILTNCDFSGNSSGGSGGGICNFSNSATFINCTFSGNTTDIGGCMENTQCNVMIKGSVFEANVGYFGGAMYNYGSDSTTTVANCVFVGNRADGDGGAIYADDSGTLTLVNCAFSGNRAEDSGGAMYGKRSRTTLTNCTLSGNVAGTDGGGVHHDFYYTGFPKLMNCILWGNRDSSGMSVSAQLFGAGTPPVYYSCIQGWTGALGGPGNINDDPFFRDADGSDGILGTENDDLRLSPGSPCIDAGKPGFVPDVVPTDLDGHSRILCERVDMGAYEFGIGDYDWSQSVNLNDFRVWKACMTGPDAGPYADGCEVFDFNYDGDVDFEDFAAMTLILDP
ncbi:MAG: hypothetical protein JSU63_16915 [Phycisphaerales bacterium]|nr:MAG: hypothetical protein JSU63_16915 [Phycisphaerales bacterium]